MGTQKAGERTAKRPICLHIKANDKSEVLRHRQAVLRRMVALLIAVILASGPVAAWSTPCPMAAPAAQMDDGCMAAMTKKREQPGKQCIEHCAALASAVCVLPTGPAPTLARATEAVPNRELYSPLSVIAVELNTPPPRTLV